MESGMRMALALIALTGGATAALAAAPASSPADRAECRELGGKDAVRNEGDAELRAAIAEHLLHVRSATAETMPGPGTDRFRP